MNKILNIEQAIEISKELNKQNKAIVVAGGFFDILHLGHIKFLQEAKMHGNFLFVLLEEDSKAQAKGKSRPLNTQLARAKILQTLDEVDYIVLLKDMTNNDSYDKIMLQIKPNTIVTTFGDPNIEHKKRQAKILNAKIAYAKNLPDYSTTKYAMKL